MEKRKIPLFLLFPHQECSDMDDPKQVSIDALMEGLAEVAFLVTLRRHSSVAASNSCSFSESICLEKTLLKAAWH